MHLSVFEYNDEGVIAQNRDSNTLHKYFLLNGS